MLLNRLDELISLNPLFSKDACTNMVLCMLVLQGTSSGVAAGEIQPEKLFPGEENGGGKRWDVRENQHGWGSLS